MESEQAALAARVQDNKYNRDIALIQFLKLLQWLRLVLFQDCALLYTEYPDCPLFRHAPFTYPSFIDFAARAAATIRNAEENARLAFNNLPDRMARTMQGYATELLMKQEQQYYDVSQQLQAMQAQASRFELMLSNQKGRNKRNGKMLSLFQYYSSG